MTLSIVMPCYNVGENVGKNIKTILDMYPTAQVIAIDDGSIDSTIFKLMEIDNERFIHLRTVSNKGKGEALNLGYRYSTGDLVCFIDGDLDINPRAIEWAKMTMEVYGADVVVGNKFHRASIVNYPIKRRVMSWLYHMLVKIMFMLPVADTQTGLKLFKRKVLTSIMPTKRIRQYAVDVEILDKAHNLGYRIVDVPVIIEHKQYGRISRGHIMGMLRDTLLVWGRKWIR